MDTMFYILGVLGCVRLLTRKESSTLFAIRGPTVEMEQASLSQLVLSQIFFLNVLDP
jgi:hypothetical protein